MSKGRDEREEEEKKELYKCCLISDYGLRDFEYFYGIDGIFCFNNILAECFGKRRNEGVKALTCFAWLVKWRKVIE